jgi:hypothetical protein
MNNAFIELKSIDFPGPAVDFRQRPTVKALPLLQYFQGDFVRIFDGVFHIPVIHLQRHRKQCACEMIEDRDRIFSFHQTSLPTDSRLAIQESGVAGFAGVQDFFGFLHRMKASESSLCSPCNS